LARISEDLPVDIERYNIKMGVKGNAEGCGWINLGHDSDQQQKIVNMVMNLLFTKR
jgi:hypothetical protein